MENASNDYEGSSVFDPSNWAGSILLQGNSALLPNGTMVRKKEKDGKVYWTDDYEHEAAVEMRQLSSFIPDESEASCQGSMPSGGHSDVEAWLTKVDDSEHQPSHQVASASHGYSVDPYATPMRFDGVSFRNNSFNAQGFEQQSFYADAQVGSIYQGGKSSQVFPAAMEWTHGVPSWNQQEPSVEDWPQVQLPSVENTQSPPQIWYCNLWSHATWLVSEDGPVTIGVRGNEVKVALKKLQEEPNMCAEARLLVRYGKWAAK
jgi:hypothetical protein